MLIPNKMIKYSNLLSFFLPLDFRNTYDSVLDKFEIETEWDSNIEWTNDCNTFLSLHASVVENISQEPLEAYQRNKV